MTRIKRDGLPDLIRWQPGDEPDWDTPDTTEGDHTWCGNCGFSSPGCGCPRDAMVAAWKDAGPGGLVAASRLLATQVAQLRIELAGMSRHPLQARQQALARLRMAARERPFIQDAPQLGDFRKAPLPEGALEGLIRRQAGKPQEHQP